MHFTKRWKMNNTLFIFAWTLNLQVVQWKVGQFASSSGDLVEVGSAFIDHVDVPFGGRAKLRSVRPSQPVSQTRPWRQTHCQVDCLASQIYFNVRWCRSASNSTLSLAE
ncbi:hypothetical protein Tsp_07755 [Trichinella spiralis]|uniref:hypothetical protein n=1 Tax=Trichinella spiralis TaxID=6334 RepID=UPI0001EFCA0C|nr:hypothetical protein Tsp_07755 [Trichinella spiralis]